MPQKTALDRADYHRQYRERNREALRSQRAAAYQRDKEQRSAKAKEYREKNRDALTTYYRERYRNSQRTTPWKMLFFSARQRAKFRQMEFTLTEEWARERWTGKCEMTGADFVLDQRGAGPKFWSPSIDRIDNARGYVPGNCRFILWAINQLKGVGTDADVLAIARAIVDGHSQSAS